MKATGKALLLILIPCALLLAARDGKSTPAAAAGTTAGSQMDEAERLFTEGLYAQAHKLYGKLDEEDLPEAEARWVDFRLADSLWRSEASTGTSDTTRLDRARAGLEALIRDVTRPEDRDRVWAEVQESLGDFWWARRESRNWGQGFTHYQAALDWWAGAAEIDVARERYLSMVWRMASPPKAQPYYYYGYYGNSLPLEILRNALEIARTEQDRAHAHYLIAMTLRQQGDARGQRRVPEEFEAALAAGRSTDWYDDALYHYAEWREQRGVMVMQEGGGWRNEPDFVGAVELYRRLLAELAKGETRYHDQATTAVERITAPTVGVAVSNIFLPDSEIEYHLSWRNVAYLRLSLYSVDLTRDIGFAGKDAGSGSWLQQIDLAGRTASRSWDHDVDDKGDHRPGRASLRIEPALAPGAYVLEAGARGEKARELILVTDAAIVLKGSRDRALAFFANAIDGSPLSEADVRLWERYHDGRDWLWRAHDRRTDADGLAVFDLTPAPRHGGRELLAAAVRGRSQAVSQGRGHYYGLELEGWRIQAFTDRPAYRPEETVRWKLVARRHDGEVYSTPAGSTLEYRIDDPRGTKVEEGSVELNAFGSAWGDLDVTASMPLGEYRVLFWTEGRGSVIGGATLFRLEEYKLPEFKVSVVTPEEDGRRKAFRLGETVEVEIAADYYFGGPVADATVEVLVHQSPFHHWWSPSRRYPWFYEDMGGRGRHAYYGGGNVVKRETLKTDARGRATLRFDTPEGSGQDFEYRIEARVTDASRREVIGSDSVRVTRQRYYVHPRPRHNLHRPGDEVTVDFKVLDANAQPVQVSGTVTVTRDHWYEVWLDPAGEEVSGDELETLRDLAPLFPPPPPRSGGPGWQLKFRGYEHDEILVRTLSTDAEGTAELSFVPEREGYYRIAWSSLDDGLPVTAQTTAWVATEASRDLGYRHGGVEIIADRDTFRAGGTVPIMLSVPTNDRYVLFTVEAEGLLEHRLVHVTGMVKLVQLEVGEEHVPNVFLGAVMLSDGAMFVDMEQVVVPPVRQFLDVTVEYDREEYQPREEGTVTLTARDHEGRPVSAEVSLGLVDESVYYIQGDYAGDPRQFFYGTKRSHRVQTSSSFQLKGYRKLIVGGDDSLVDARMDAPAPSREMDELEAYGQVAGMAADMDSAGGRKRAAAKSLARPEALAEESAAAPTAQYVAAPDAGPAVQVRSDFRSTMFWQPDVVTGDDGRAEVAVRFPDSLTGWKATARAAGTGSRFGFAEGLARTQKPLIVRLQAPRFFVAGDRTTISAVMNNNTEDAMTVRPDLRADGIEIVGVVEAGAARRGDTGLVTIPPGGESRVDWQVSAVAAGPAELTVEARGGDHADAMRRAYTVHEHGIEKLVTTAGKMRGDGVTATLDLPAERRPGSTGLVVQVAPSMAVTMLDALPYLIDYPYGCTEQTMSRFLPAAITARTLRDLGISPEAAMATVFGGIEGEHAGATHPDGKQSLEELDAMVRRGLERLYDFQHGDGGWGWWKEGDSDHFMTAYVVWGLSVARDAGIRVRGNAVERAVRFLAGEIIEAEERPDMAAWMLHALAVEGSARKTGRMAGFTRAAFDRLWEDRGALNAYTRALLALAAHHLGDAERAEVLVRNLENGVKSDRSPDTSVVQRGGQSSSDAVLGTAHWGEDGVWWRWSDGGVEATAFALRALLAIDPGNELIEPVTNWLVKNRRGAQWSNTRDTAITVLALNDYLRVSGELGAELEYELLVNGHSVARQRIGGDDALGAPARFEIEPGHIRDGANEIRLVRHAGDGPLYFAAEARFFSQEEPITPAGNEIFVRRQYYKLVGRPTLLKGYVYDRVPLNDGESVASGERVEAVITIEAKNNYEYLVFEDLKPAGLEAVQIRSGEPLYARELKSGAVADRFAPAAEGGRSVEGSDLTGRSRWVYQELRDRKVALFLDKLPEGVWEIRYDLRAEVPGEFHALPVLGHAMYVPEIRCNGQEVRIEVIDRPEGGS